MSNNGNAKKKSWIYYLIAIFVLLFGGTQITGTIGGESTPPPAQTTVVTLPADGQVVQEAAPIETITYSFRNEKLLNDHYEKHGREMGFDSAESYEAAANEIINHPDTLHRIEEEDGDDVYYLEENNGFVIVSIDGYIRTFFYPDDGLEYFNRQ